jgi:Glyoxalase-like domain
MTNSTPSYQLDHLAVAGLDLLSLSNWAIKHLGVTPSPGGQHLGFGTHNLLLSLGPEVYLELIAPDPAQDPRTQRLFGLGDPAVLESLKNGPKLHHWIARSTDFSNAVAHQQSLSAFAVPMQRGDLKWSLYLPDDRTLPPAGIPTLIDWGSTLHPCGRLPDSGLRIEAFESAPTLKLSLNTVNGLVTL